MAKIIIDKTHWSWKHKIKYFIFSVIRRPLLKVSDYKDANSVNIGSNTSFGNCLEITLKGRMNNVRIGNNCHLNKTNSFFIQGDNNTIDLGNNIIFDQNVLLVTAEGTQLSVGNECLFANGVQIRTTDQHPIFNNVGERINPSADVTISNHVWIGTGAIICKGVTIGEGAVIGARSIVTKDVPPHSIAVGTPAKVVKTDVHWSRKYEDISEQLRRFGYN